MSNIFNNLNPFVRNIAPTQAKYQLIKKDDGKTGQGSYYLSLDLEEYLINKNAIKKDESLSNVNNTYYVLSDDVKLKLKKGVIDIIGPAYDNDNNKVLLVNSVANDGTTKFQIKRTDHKDNEYLNWFMKLYDNNCEGAQFKLYFNDEDRTLYIDNDLNIDKTIENLNSENNLANVMTNLKEYSKNDFLNDVFMNEQEYSVILNLLVRKKNLILQGSPGVGKTFMAKRLAYSILGYKDDSKILSVQFHQSYSYEDFIEGIRPNEEGIFTYTPGAFKEFIDKAINDKNHKYFCIIDEINRGNLSKILGELMKLIESDKRGKENVILPYSKKPFTVPSNIYIIGTMNTADRSLAMVDYALRRRFAFYRVVPAFNKPEFKKYLMKNTEDSGVNNLTSQQVDDLCDKFIKLNSKISDELGSGFEVGHSYFVNTLNRTKFNVIYKEILEYEIVPLLEEYWFDDDTKVEDYKEML